MTSTAESVVDAHLHLWDGTLRQPWLAGSGLPEQAGAEDAAAAVPSAAAVAVEAGADSADALAEVAWLETRPGVGAIVAGIDLFGDVETQLDALADHRLVTGVRHNLQDLADLDDPRLVMGLTAIAERGLVFDLCLRHHQLDAAAALVAQVDAGVFVLDHLGKPPVRAGGADDLRTWSAGLARVLAAGDVMLKVSGLSAEADPDRPLSLQADAWVSAALDLAGPGRCCLGSDWPVSLRAPGHDWDGWVRLVGRRAERIGDRDGVLAGNATERYGWGRQRMEAL